MRKSGQVCRSLGARKAYFCRVLALTPTSTSTSSHARSEPAESDTFTRPTPFPPFARLGTHAQAILMQTRSIPTPQVTFEMGTRGVFFIDPLKSTHAAPSLATPSPLTPVRSSRTELRAVAFEVGTCDVFFLVSLESTHAAQGSGSSAVPVAHASLHYCPA